MPPITSEDVEYLKAIFVTREDCDKETAKIKEEQHAHDKKIDIMNMKLTWILGIIGAIGASVGGWLIAQLLGVIS